MTHIRLWHVLLALAGLGIVALAAWRLLGEETPAPATAPQTQRFTLPDLVSLDPEVQSLLHDRFAKAEAAPSEATRWLELGMSLHANDLVDEALEPYGRVPTLDPDPTVAARAAYYSALVHTQRAEDDEALIAFDAARNIDPSYAPASWRRGFLHLNLGEIDRAETDLLEAQRVDRELGGSEAVWIGLAQVDLMRDRPDDAAKRLELFLQQPRRNERYAWLLLGDAYRQLGRAEEARSALERGRGSDAHFSDPWEQELFDHRPSLAARLSRITVLLEVGRYDEAVALLEPLRETHPDDPLVRRHLSVAYRATGRLEASFEEIRAGLALDPEDPMMLLNGAATLIEMSYRAPEHAATLRERATVLLARSIERNPGHFETHLLRGDVLFHQGDHNAALEAYGESVRCAPDRALPRFRTGVVLLNLHRWGEAAAAFQQALDRDPRHHDSLIGLANALIEMNESAQARAALERAARIQPDDPRIRTLAQRLRGAGP